MIRERIRRNNITTILTILLVTILLSGCAGDDDDTDGGTGDRDQPDLEGASWYLSLLNGDGLLLLSIITADFGEDGMVSGLAGCNGYKASYTVEGDRVSIAEPVTTEASCRNLLMQQESAYLDTLVSAVSYQILGTTLEMRDGEGRAMLVYDTALPTNLPGTAWSLLEYSDDTGSIVPVLPGTSTTADFDDGGILSGSAGCNSYSGSYDVAAKLINIESVSMTEMYCAEPEGIMDQESQYLASLSRAAAYIIVGEAMALLSEDESLVATYKSELP